MARRKSTPAPEAPEARVTAVSRYESLAAHRSPFLQRARDCAAVTIPALMPPEGANGSTDFSTPFQSIGARAVNNLSSKIVLALFPPGSSFFRLLVSPKIKDEATIAGEQGINAMSAIEKELSSIETKVVNKLESQGARASFYEAIRHVIATGNGLLRVTAEGGFSFHKLSSYVCKRDGDGNVLEIVLKQSLAFVSLPKSIRTYMAAHEAAEGEMTHSDDNIDLYTWVKFDGSKWNVHQEVEGMIIEETRGTYPKGKSPWIPLRFSKLDGEDYGRGLVEEYLGDIQSLESLAQSIVEGSAAAAKVLFFVNEGGVTSKQVMAEAPNGAFVDGDARDVSTLQLDKFADFRIAAETTKEIQQRLAAAFLLNTSVQRQAERVTAEEIRFLAVELEDALGGVYSVLATEFQRPVVVRLMYQLERAGEIKPMKEGDVQPQIVTGLEALGRSHDLQKLDLLIAGAAQTLGQDVVAKYVNAGEYFLRRSVALAVDSTGLIRTDEEVQQADQAAQQQELAKQAVGPGIKAVGDQLAAAGTAPPTPEG